MSQERILRRNLWAGPWRMSRSSEAKKWERGQREARVQHRCMEEGRAERQEIGCGERASFRFLSHAKELHVSGPWE